MSSKRARRRERQGGEATRVPHWEPHAEVTALVASIRSIAAAPEQVAAPVRRDGPCPAAIRVIYQHTHWPERGEA